MGILEILLQRVGSLAKSGSAKLVGDVTLSEGSNVMITQVGQDIEIAATGGGGPPAAVTWNPDSATDSAALSYETWAEVRAIGNSTRAPLKVRVLNNATTSGTSSDDFAHVTFVADDPTATLTFTEGVELRGPAFDGPFSVGSSATTTNALQYDQNAVGIFRGGVVLSGSGTRGLMTVTGTGAEMLFESAVIGEHTFESTTASTVGVYMPGSKFVDTAQFFGASGATFEFKRNADTVGDVDLTALTATVSTPGALDEHHAFVFDLNDVAGTTTFSSTGTDALTFVVAGGSAGDPVFGHPQLWGDGCYFEDGYWFSATADIPIGRILDQMTVEFWVKELGPNFMGAYNVELVEWDNAGSEGPFWAYLNSGQLHFGIETTTTGGARVFATTRALFCDSTPHYVMASYDGADLKVYVDGVLWASQAVTGNVLGGGGGAAPSIGNQSNGYYVLGRYRISDIARSAAYAKAVYQQGAFGR